MGALLHFEIPDQQLLRRGKVRDVYDLGDEVLIVSTDRLSAFDVVMNQGVFGKGRILNQLSAFWFSQLSPVCPHHLVTTTDDLVAARIGHYAELEGRCAIGVKAEPLPIECVVRGYISGSLMKEYRKSGSNIYELNLPEGLSEADKLPEPIFTPATKASSGHDENISASQAIDLIGKDFFDLVSTWSLELYRRAAEHAAQRGLILADTKFEFGIHDGSLIWIDEALTPDSSRYWNAASYQPGKAQESFDKQPFRDYLESIAWNKQPPPPDVPKDVLDELRVRYETVYRRLVQSVAVA